MNEGILIILGWVLLVSGWVVFFIWPESFFPGSLFIVAIALFLWKPASKRLRDQ